MQFLSLKGAKKCLILHVFGNNCVGGDNFEMFSM